MTSQKDKFGFYLVGDFKTYSKVEAMEMHRITGHHPHWYFNESWFLSYDWTIDPVKSLDELYAERARQIRNDYDHVVIFYSGGADSFNIVDTFIQNGIPFDEIATYNYQKADSDPTSGFNAELVQVAFPQIRTWQQQGIQFQHRHVDLSDTAYNIIHDDFYRLDWAYFFNNRFNTNNLARSYIREIVPDYQTWAQQGKKIAFVWGSDKPRLYKEGDRYCIKFLDIINQVVSPRTQILAREWEYDELFYWAPECRDIMCKQAHRLMRFVETHNVFKDGQTEINYVSDRPANLTTGTMFVDRRTEDGLSLRNLINCLLYPRWDNNTFSIGKNDNHGGFTSPREHVWLRDQLFREKLDRSRQHLLSTDRYWWNDPNNLEKGLKLCVSPAYFLQ